MAFREIDDDLWAIVQKYLPPTKPHIGRPRCDPRSPRKISDFPGRRTQKRSPCVQRYPVRPEYRLHPARCPGKLRHQIDGSPVTTLNYARRGCTRRSSSTCSNPGMRSGRHGKSEIFLTGNCRAVSVSISRAVRRIPRLSRRKKGIDRL